MNDSRERLAGHLNQRALLSRAIEAEAEAASLRIERASLQKRLESSTHETRALRERVDELLAEIGQLRETTAVLEARRGTAQIDVLARTLMEAIDRASDGMVGWSIGRVQAELRALLALDGDEGARLSLIDPGRVDPSALSQLSFEIAALPSRLGGSQVSPGDAVRAALLDLQAALDTPADQIAQSAIRAQAQIAFALQQHATISPQAAAALDSTVETLRQLASGVPEISQPVEAAGNAHRFLASNPSEAALFAFADALSEVAEIVRNAN